MALFNPFRESVPSAVTQPKLLPPASVVSDDSNHHRAHPSKGFVRNEGSIPRCNKPRGGGYPRGRSGRGRSCRGRGGNWRSRFDGDNVTAEPRITVEFQCEACERVFVNESDLNDHLGLHVSCAHCNYAALQQLVDLHIKLVHDKQLASKVMEQSPEEIAEYLAERRRRFPRRKTEGGADGEQKSYSAQENVTPSLDEQRKGIIHEENVRGNRKGKFGHLIEKNRHEPSTGEQSQRPKQRRRRRAKRSRNQQESPVVAVQDEGPQMLEGVPRFRGVPAIAKTSKSAEKLVEDEANRNGDDISDVDDFTPTCPTQLTASKVLVSLMACYSDSDEEVKQPPKVPRLDVNQNNGEDVVIKKENGLVKAPTDESPQQLDKCKLSKTIKHSNKVQHQPKPKSAEEQDAIKHSAMTKVSPVAFPIKATVQALVDKVVLEERATKLRNIKPPQISQRKLSLLEKLLAKDIRHERNILLQCVDFVVQNNFFDGMDYDV